MTAVTSFLDGRVAFYAGDCAEILPSLPDASVDACVTDPPYHLTSIVKRFGSPDAAAVKAGKTGAFARASRGFMGQTWDGGDIACRVELWAEVWRVLKPGAYILAFSSSRTFGRMAVAIEDAGFINHPLIGWIFSSGFPKATRIKAEGYEGHRYGAQALKPALEPIYMGQKPFSEPTGTANILKYGTGALNIDGCRVGTDDAMRAGAGRLWSHSRDGEASADRRYHESGSTNFAATPGPRGGDPLGRWPANLVHDGSPEVLAGFPQTASGKPGDSIRNSKGFSGIGDSGLDKPIPLTGFGDSGSAARFFYSAKADADDRLGSNHPTVKPVDLMRWLVRLVTPKGGAVLDPFAGTGTTGEAAWREGMNAVLIEREAPYQADIARRMTLCLAGPDERARAAAKARFGDLPAGPLFAEAAE